MDIALFNRFIENMAIAIISSDTDESEIISRAIANTDGMDKSIFFDWMSDSNFSKLYTNKLIDVIKIKSFPKLLTDAIRDSKKPLDVIKFLSDSKNALGTAPSEKSFSIATLDYLRAVQSIIIHPDDAKLQLFDEEAKHYKNKFEVYLKDRLQNYSVDIGGTKE